MKKKKKKERIALFILNTSSAKSKKTGQILKCSNKNKTNIIIQSPNVFHLFRAFEDTCLCDCTIIIIQSSDMFHLLQAFEDTCLCDCTIIIS